MVAKASAQSVADLERAMALLGDGLTPLLTVLLIYVTTALYYGDTVAILSLQTRNMIDWLIGV